MAQQNTLKTFSLANKRRHSLPLHFSEEKGMRYLHFGSSWVQGAMRIQQPEEIVLEYVQQMMAWLLFLPATQLPLHIMQLGLGAAALTKFCYHYFTQADIVAVELSPDVIVAAHSMFKLPQSDQRLNIIQTDAAVFVQQPHYKNWATIIQVDLYDEHAHGPVIDSLDFYRACGTVLQTPGILTVNLFGYPENLPASLQNLKQAFKGRILTFAPTKEGNVVALAFQGLPISVEWKILYDRAEILEQYYHWPVSKWLTGLRMLNPLSGNKLEI